MKVTRWAVMFPDGSCYGTFHDNDRAQALATVERMPNSTLIALTGEMKCAHPIKLWVLMTADGSTISTPYTNLDAAKSGALVYAARGHMGVTVVALTGTHLR